MKTYSIVTKTSIWSLASLVTDVENILNEKTKEGYEIVTVSFGTNLWWFPTAYITLAKNE
ncbi:MAG: hypothetical protein M3413_01905 [Bacteroidota bacterium]|nr:hypothetical protein [Flavisolibacter sp.]MDQ3550258.1 hypothetical protein [Bacteroidota bacterium]